jgi:RNA polymerase sigma factor (sigma-70 family)
MEDDARLVADALVGRREAYRALYERHRCAATRVAEGFAELDAEEVQEIVTRTFVRAFASLRTLREPGRFGPHALTLARKQCLGRLAKKKAPARLLSLPRTEGELELAREPGVVGERQLVVEQILAGFSPAERELLAQFYERRVPAREIADRSEIGRIGITRLLERFRARLKLRLAARILEARGAQAVDEGAGMPRRE